MCCSFDIEDRLFTADVKTTVMNIRFEALRAVFMKIQIC